MSGSRQRFLCLDCEQDTGKMYEFYFVHTELWLSAVGSKDGMLCIGCLEARLGRMLDSHDFTDCMINKLSYSMKSDRLLRRIRRGA